MKVKELVDILSEQSGRLPVLLVGANGVKRWLSWHYMCDYDWEDFQFILSEGEWHPLDTDGAIMLMNHALNNPDIRHELTPDYVAFPDYKVGVTWPLSSGAWGCSGISTGKYEYREPVPVTIKPFSGIKDIAGGMVTLFCNSDLPEAGRSDEQP